MMTRVKAVVVSRDGSYAAIDDGHQTAMAAGALSFGDELLDMHAAMAGQESVLVIPHAWRDPLAFDRLRMAGWAYKPATEGTETEGGWGAWTTFVKGSQAVHVGVLSIMDPARTPLFTVDALPHVISRRLADMHRLIGTAYRKTPGVVGAAMIRDRYDRDGAYAQPRWFVTLPDGVRGVGDIIWSRPRVGREREARWIHGYDVHGAYLSAATMADLAWGDLARVVLPQFDPAVAGLWQLAGHSTYAPRWPGGRMAPPLIHPARFDEDNNVWLTTPMVRFLVECGARPDIRQALVAAPVPRGPSTRRVLRVWGEAIRNARRDVGAFYHDADRAAFKATLKRVPNEAIGLLKPTTGRGRVNRADWAWTVRDVNRVNVLRKIRDIYRRTGRWPVRVRTDAVYYALDLEDAGLAARTQLGIELAATWSPGRWHSISTDVAHDWTDPIPSEDAA